ncbi:CDP-alcohol phosphatidyltransferase family protein [Candidatus Woesearchaeota archaeon]|nr:CDP-alcohol phosphatidyltransferase family protein [Candidatus Woesearchaeota archaeon]
MPEIVNGQRKVWNPLARYYIEPIGEWIAERLKNTIVTPNFITLINTILSPVAGLLLFSDNYLHLVLFAIWVRIFHIIDIIDGHLARITDKKSKFGGLFDGISDRFVVGSWFALIAISLYVKSSNHVFLLFGILLLFGEFIYTDTAMLSDKIYVGHIKKDKVKQQLKRNAFAKIFLTFIDNDISWHLLTLAALLNRLDIFLIFYAIYVNLVWMSYLGYYFLKHITGG